MKKPTKLRVMTTFRRTVFIRAEEARNMRMCQTKIGNFIFLFFEMGNRLRLNALGWGDWGWRLEERCRVKLRVLPGRNLRKILKMPPERRTPGQGWRGEEDIGVSSVERLMIADG